MKKYFLFVASALVALTLGMSSCKGKTDPVIDPENPSVNPDKPSVTEVLTPEQSKEKLMSVAKNMVGVFNPDDQKEAIELADGLYEKYRDYSWNEVGDYLEEKYEPMFTMPRYIKDVLLARRSPASAEPVVFSFENESLVIEADDASRSWKVVGKASDNSIILRFTDKAGTKCEAKFWGEGKTKTYEYVYQDYHWDAPKIFVDDSAVAEASGYYDGEWRYFRRDENGWFYEEEYYDEDAWEWRYRNVYVSLSDVDDIYAYNYDYSLQYDRETGHFFYYDWRNEYKVVDGERTYKGVIPAKILFTLKQGDKTIISEELEQDLEMNDHVTLSLNVKVVNLSWILDMKIGWKSGSVAFDFKYNNERVLGVAANMPSYKLIDKPEEMTYEDWAEQYGERYEELIKNIGEVTALVDLMGEAQIQMKVENVGYAYRDFRKADGYDSYSKSSVQHFCDLINDNQTNGLYYNSPVLQAKVIAQVRSDYDNYYGEQRYEPEGVLFFPADSTTYAFEEYFNRKPFTDLQYTVEDLINKYIQLSKFLYDEVGEVRF